MSSHPPRNIQIRLFITFFPSVKKSTFFTLELLFFTLESLFFHAGRCSVKKSNSSAKKSNFSVKKLLFFTLASMKKSRFGKEKCIDTNCMA
jgi:hypothetical protein